MDIAISKKVDICFLNETWFKKAKNDVTEQIEEEYLYKSFHSNVFGRGKGIAVLLRKKLQYKKVELNLKFSSFDAIVLHLTNSTCLICMYRYYKWGSAFDVFLAEFASLLSNIALSCDSYAICGDINVHIKQPVGFIHHEVYGHY